MKRTYEMVESKFNCEYCHHENCEGLCENQYQSDGNCRLEKSNQNFKSKKSKFIDYIKESFQSVRRWFSGPNKESSSNLVAKEITTNKADHVFLLGFGCTNYNRYHENKRPINYSFAIKSPSYKSNASNTTNSHLFEHVISPVQLTKRYMKELNWRSGESVPNMYENVKRQLNMNTTDNIKKSTSRLWSTNSFLLRSSNMLNPRHYNYATVGDKNTEMDHTEILIDLHSGKMAYPVSPPRMGTNLVDNNINLYQTEPACPSLTKIFKNGLDNCKKATTKTNNLSTLNFSGDYFNMKLVALDALTSNDYHQKEKDYIVQQIKQHQEKRRQLKNQYESLIGAYFEQPLGKQVFPKLDQGLLQTYYECITNGSINGFDVKLPNENISCKDLRTLLDLNWLNDEVINFYLGLINKRSNNDNINKENKIRYPLVHSFNTFFYEKLSRSGYNGVKRWTKKMNIFEKRFILIPIHLAVHWCLCVVDNLKKTINYYDSLLSPNYDCIERIKAYLVEEYNTKYNKSINFESWLFDCPHDIPKQANGSDCGVFACTFGEYISRDAALDFNQENMPYFRQKMIYEIFQNKLLL